MPMPAAVLTSSSVLSSTTTNHRQPRCRDRNIGAPLAGSSFDHSFPFSDTLYNTRVVQEHYQPRHPPNEAGERDRTLSRQEHGRRIVVVVMHGDADLDLRYALTCP